MSVVPTDGPVRWGILATGRIAHTFARDLALLDGHVVAAVGSRSQESADAFAAERGGRAHASYEALVEDPDVDVVYVASPHGRHLDDVRLCLAARKAVLCEKALTLDLATSRELVDEARRQGTFLAEAMWMRTHPLVRRVRELVDEGVLGTVTQVRAELGFAADASVARLWEPDLGASALLDIGIYPLTLAHVVLGGADVVAAAGTLHERGFDTAGGATLVHPGGGVSSVAWTQLAQSDNRASIAGDAGRIEIPRRFHHPTSLELTRGDTTTTITADVVGRGYAHEALEVEACLRAGRTESDLLPLDGTLAVMAQMDEIRRQIAASAPTA